MTIDKGYKENIICPECESLQTGFVEYSSPWNVYIHTCGECGYIITESDWQKA